MLRCEDRAHSWVSLAPNATLCAQPPITLQNHCDVVALCTAVTAPHPGCSHTCALRAAFSMLSSFMWRLQCVRTRSALGCASLWAAGVTLTSVGNAAAPKLSYGAT